jgi:hypothetical protein
MASIAATNITFLKPIPPRQCDSMSPSRSSSSKPVSSLPFAELDPPLP